MILDSPFSRALNHLLAAEPWARERLIPFAGETLEVVAPPLPPVRFMILESGLLAPLAEGATAGLSVKVRPGAPLAALRGEEYLLGAVDISGNARLASELMFLVRHLRWDAEEDLSRLVGDIAAHRIVGFARDALAWHRDAARRLAEGLVEYAAEEKRLLVARDELSDMAQAQASLRDALDRLEARIARLAERR